MEPDDRARAAHRLQHDPLFQELLKHLREAVMGEFSGSAEADQAARERAYFKLVALQQIEVQVQLWAKPLR